MATTKKRNLSPASELNAIAGAEVDFNHNETMVRFPNLPTKQQQFPENKPTKLKELQALTLKDLEAIAGGRLSLNHNETVVKFPSLSQKPKPASQVQPNKNKKLLTLTSAELDVPRVHEVRRRLAARRRRSFADLIRDRWRLASYQIIQN